MKPLLLLLVLVLSGPLTGPAPAGVAASAEPDGVWPLRPEPEVVRPFDPPDAAWTAGHRGVDLRGSIGQPVRAALAGDVSFIGTIAGTAVVVVDHGEVRTTYQPVDATVRRGATVAAGDVIGRLHWFGTHCLPAACLHWGLIEGDRYLDPLTLVGGPQPVRLLPLDPGAAPLGTPLDAPLGAPPSARVPLVAVPSTSVPLPWSPLSFAGLVPWGWGSGALR